MVNISYFSKDQQIWLEQNLNALQYRIQGIQPLKEHADHRKYYRIITQRDSIICMQSSALFNLKQFIHSSTLLKKSNIPVANILATSTELGMSLLTDLGPTALLSLAKTRNPDYIFYYQQSIDCLINWQQQTPSTYNYPTYDHHKAGHDAQLCLEWFCQNWAHTQLSKHQKQIWDDSLTYLLENWKQTPLTLCHRDYHSDNLLISNNKVSIIDHQDLAYGPLYYDIASLITDHYFSHSNKVKKLLLAYYLKKTVGVEQSDIHKQYHSIVYQRHLKNLGIFCRLHCRDNKSWYLKYLPRLIQTMEQSAIELPILAPLQKIISNIYLNRLSLQKAA